jgi:hypothetical protein
LFTLPKERKTKDRRTERQKDRKTERQKALKKPERKASSSAAIKPVD